MSAGRSSLKRNRPSRPPYQRFLIVCEGEKSEPSYIHGISSLCRGQLIEVDVVGGAGQTKKVVERAIELQKQAAAKARRNADLFERYDRVWCVLDVDDHLLLQEAIIQARDNGISIALSNPCFEIWVILHHRDERRSVPRAALQGECKTHYSERDKHVPFEKLWPAYGDAQRRARDLRTWQLDMGRVGGDPWTDFDLLVEELLTLRRK